MSRTLSTDGLIIRSHTRVHVIIDRFTLEDNSFRTYFKLLRSWNFQYMILSLLFAKRYILVSFYKWTFKVMYFWLHSIIGCIDFLKGNSVLTPRTVENVPVFCGSFMNDTHWLRLFQRFHLRVLWKLTQYRPTCFTPILLFTLWHLLSLGLYSVTYLLEESGRGFVGEAEFVSVLLFQAIFFSIASGTPFLCQYSFLILFILRLWYISMKNTLDWVSLGIFLNLNLTTFFLDF
jgi:hypothetical protein